MLPISSPTSEPDNQNLVTSSTANIQDGVNIESVTGSTEKPQTSRTDAPEFVYSPAYTFPEQESLEVPLELQGVYGYTPRHEPHFISAPMTRDLIPSEFMPRETIPSHPPITPEEYQHSFRYENRAFYQERASLPPFYHQMIGVQENPVLMNHPHRGLLYHPELNLYRDPKTNSYFSFDPRSGLFRDSVSGGFFGYNPINQLFFNPYTGQYLVPTVPTVPTVPILNPNIFVEHQTPSQFFDTSRETTLTTPIQPKSERPNVFPHSHQTELQDDSEFARQAHPIDPKRAAAFNEVLTQFDAPDFNYQDHKILEIVTRLKDHAINYNKKLLPEEVETLTHYLDKCLMHCNKWNINTLATTLIQLSSINFFEPNIKSKVAKKRSHFLNLLVQETRLKMNWKDIHRRASSVYIHLCLIANNQTTLSDEITEYFNEFHQKAIENTTPFYLGDKLHLFLYISLIIEKIDCTDILNALVPALVPETFRIENQKEKYSIVKSLDELQRFIDTSTIFTTENSEIINDFIIRAIEKLNENRRLLSPDDILKIIRCVARVGHLPAIPINSLIEILDIIKPSHIANMIERHRMDMMYLLMCIVAKYTINDEISSIQRQNVTQKIGYLYNINKQKQVLEYWEKPLLSQTAVFLDEKDEFPFETNPIVSPIQSIFENKFRDAFPSLNIMSEYQVNHLPPIDIAIPELNILIEINGIYHYSFHDKNAPNGRTTLKKYLYKKLGFEIFTINLLNNSQLQKKEFEHIVKRIRRKIEERQLSMRLKGIKF